MGTICKFCFNNINIIKLPLSRHGHVLRGKPPGVARSLKERLEEINYKDPSLHYKVDIGFPKQSSKSSTDPKGRLNIYRENKHLEPLARKKQLEIPLNEVKEIWKRESAASQIKSVADHYGIYDDLFGDAYFFPSVMLDVHYKQSEDTFAAVHRGNVIKPSEAVTAPAVSYDADADTLWTLILTNPDGHFTLKDAEYVHWFVGNIPGNNISKGEVIWDYLQPFPPRGTGFHRFVFILYKQEKKMDYEMLKKDGSCLRLTDRTFRTLDFYRERQDDITPAGLAFFQSDWDSSLTNFFHNTLNMQEPVFEYDFPPPYHPPQKWFPLKQAFNLYMDRYRDQKQIAKEYLLMKLSKTHPFEKPPPPLKYPNAHRYEEGTPSWLKTEIRKNRLGWGRINDF
ncbi:39S ribosomal protein L38, mitochondrial [Schistocerca gregaria]|uniref:39S ribosomal protein L38, mitochondrial n=1 Tax=Schistocerca gregaria TaxID=7010 RepID=UPI00211DD772|nr:39S ribosomal protein L38, mitochondrial [Schistocerca gregaria]